MSNQSSVTSYQYNGLGDRLQETVNGVTTTFTMDLNTGLTQALSDGTNTYVYGMDRIAQAAGTTTEYFLGDALGSVRQLTDATGAITYARAYDPYGVVTSTLGSSQSAYAFTGEYYGDSTQLTYLRSRFYASGTGRFLTRDTWGGDYNRPLSLNRWNYVEANPINLVDPTGKFPEWCRSKWTKWGYAKCVLDYYHIEPAGSIYFNGDAVAKVKGSSGCWSGPIEYRAGGYIEGYSWFGTVVWGGKEVVYSFARMERSEFTYIGGGLSDSVLGGGYALYAGLAEGLRSDKPVTQHYMGLAYVKTGGFDISLSDIGIGLGLGITETIAVQDWKLKTLSAYIGVSATWVGLPLFDAGRGFVNYTPSEGTYYPYYQSGEVATMLIDMIEGRHTPYPPAIQDMNLSALYTIRGYVAASSAKYFFVYEEMRNEELRSKNTN